MNKSSLRVGWSMIAVLLVSGCAHYQPRPISPAQTAAELEARTLHDPGLRKFLEANLRHPVEQWPLDSWDFETLTLAAFYYHPDLDVARARWGTVRAGMITAGESPNPTLSAVPGFDTTTYTPSPWTPAVSLDIPIETAHKRGYRVAEARRLAESARLNIAATAWQVRGRLHQALLQLYGAEQIADMLKKQEAARSAIVDFVQRQQGLGMVSALDISQARIGLTNVRLSGLEAARQIAEARVAVAEAIGIPVQAIASVPIHFQPPDAPPVSGTSLPELRRAALQSRADVRAALADYAAAQAALQLEIAKQYPDVHLGPGYQFDQGDNKWTLGLAIELPVFNHNQGPIAEAEGRRTVAAMNLVAVQARIIGEIDRALSRYNAARDKADAAHKMLSDLEAQRSSAKRLFDAGELSRLELMTLNLELQVDEQAELDAAIGMHQAFGALEDALQRPLGINEASLLKISHAPTTLEAVIR